MSLIVAWVTELDDNLIEWKVSKLRNSNNYIVYYFQKDEYEKAMSDITKIAEKPIQKDKRREN